jgi:hypothetical protein
MEKEAFPFHEATRVEGLLSILAELEGTLQSL